MTFECRFQPKPFKDSITNESVLCSAALIGARKTEPGFNRPEGHKHGAPLSYPRPGVTFGDLEGERMQTGGTIVHMAAAQDGTKWHRPFLVFWESQGYH